MVLEISRVQRRESRAWGGLDDISRWGISLRPFICSLDTLENQKLRKVGQKSENMKKSEKSKIAKRFHLRSQKAARS